MAVVYRLKDRVWFPGVGDRAVVATAAQYVASETDYRRLLAEARKTKTLAGAPQRVEVVLWLSQPHELRQVMDSVGGVARTVVPLYVQITSLDPGADGAVQVESERKLMPFLVTHEQCSPLKYPLAEGLHRFNLTLRTGEPPFLLSRWSPESLRAYLDGYTPAPAQVLVGIESVFHFSGHLSFNRYA